MFPNRLLVLLAALACLSGLPEDVRAAQVDCDSVYCFTGEDFGEELTGICITGLPEAETGTLLLGDRQLKPGDAVPAGQLAEMTFSPMRSREDRSAQLEYLPIYADRVEDRAVMTISIRGKEDKAPVAEDSGLETYKNLPCTDRLKVSDPEGQAMTYTVTRQPRRGSVVLDEQGGFTYTPKHNKVGVDSFCYTATDASGQTSREATVTVTILKPTEAPQYTDTLGRECRFAAEWMKHTGIFVGETLADNACFHPDRQVTRGEFVTMLVKALEIPGEESSFTGYTDEIPTWLRPYLAAAVRSGLTAGLPEQDIFGEGAVITGGEAAVMLQNVLDLSVPTSLPEEGDCPWAAPAIAALGQEGIELDALSPMTRAQTATMLYRMRQLLDQRENTPLV